MLASMRKRIADVWSAIRQLLSLRSLLDARPIICRYRSGGARRLVPLCWIFSICFRSEDRRRLECYSPTSFLTQLARCTADYLPLPKWRRQAARPSLLDLLNLLRHQIFARGVDAPMVNFDDLTSAATPPDVKSSKLTMRRKMPAFPNASRPTRCATPSPRICWKTEPTRASFRRSVWA